MEEQVKQIIEKKATQKEATLILAFALMEVMKQLDESEKVLNAQRAIISDFPIIKRLVFGAVGTILLAVMGSLVALVARK